MSGPISSFAAIDTGCYTESDLTIYKRANPRTDKTPMISLYDILEASSGQLFGEPAAQIFTEFALDPLDAVDGTLFLALKSDTGDTHLYIEEAVRNGCSGIICTKPPETSTRGVSVVLVRDTVDALLAWAQHVLKKQGPRVIAVTGSVGKSVAVETIAAILGTRYNVHAAPDAGDGRLSVPLALAGLKGAHDFVVLKLPSTQPGEMATMVQAARPEVAVVTHIGALHQGRFDSPAQYAAEKGILVEYLEGDALAVLNYDNDIVRALASRTQAEVRMVGLDGFGADMMAYNVVVSPTGTGFDLRYGDARYVARWVPMLGRHLLYSIMSALIVGMHSDVSLEDGLEALKTLDALPGRMHPLAGTHGCLLVDDTYNANAQSTLDALAWLASVKTGSGRAVFVMGDMDGGSEANRGGYRTIGQRAAETVDVLVAQGVDAAQVARAALDAGLDPRQVCTTYSSRDTVTALEHRYNLNAEDTVLVKGGSGARTEDVIRLLLADEADSEQLLQRQFHVEVSDSEHAARPAWVEIDAVAIANNTQLLKSLIGDDVMLMAVVKADAYGHGAIVTAQTALLNGAEALAVSSAAEAFELREAGITAPVLILSYTSPALLPQIIRQDIAVTVYDLETASLYDRVARDVAGTLKMHLKLDTGMGRLGSLSKDALTLFRYMSEMKQIRVEGLYTHFSTADDDPEYVQQQLDAFKAIMRPLQATTGHKFKYVHAANSAATLAHPEAHFNMVRCGLALYGLHPSEKVSLSPDFMPALTWKTSVIQAKTLPAGHAVGYGNTYFTEHEERVAVLPIGYSEGFRRGPDRPTEVLIRGQRAPVRGRVSMEKTVVSVDHIPGVMAGDEVVLLGSQGAETITAEDIAAQTGTINYEVVTAISPHVPRRV